MNIFKNLKIRTKLLILIILMIVGTVVIGLMGTYYYKQSSKSLDDVYQQNVMSIVKLGEVGTLTKANFINILDLMMTSDENEMTIIWKNYQSTKKTIDKSFSELKTKISSTDMKQYDAIHVQMGVCDKLSNQMITSISSGKQGEAVDTFKKSGRFEFEKLQKLVSKLSDDNIKEAGNVNKSNNADGKTTVTIFIIFIAVISVFCIAFGLIITQSITKPISRITHLIEKTAALDLVYDNKYDALGAQTNEIGFITKSVMGLRDVLRDLVSNVSNISNNLASSSVELASSTSENTKTINQIVNAINEIAQGNNSQADMVSVTGETVLTMVSYIDEVNKSTATNSDNAAKSIDIIAEGHKAIDLTVEKMIENKKKTGVVGESINELSNQMEKVSNIIGVIKEISSQTNLLALNASIEAARAGESGRGFAVVATEIGNLAQDTASAVNQITGIITDAVLKNKTTAEHVEKVQELAIEQEKAIDITKEAFQKIKTSVDDIAQRSITIAERINVIDASAKDISEKTQDMSAVAEESAASSEEISASNQEQLASIEMIASAAKELSNMAANLNNEISRFKL